MTEWVVPIIFEVDGSTNSVFVTTLYLKNPGNRQWWLFRKLNMEV